MTVRAPTIHLKRLGFRLKWVLNRGIGDTGRAANLTRCAESRIKFEIVTTTRTRSGKHGHSHGVWLTVGWAQVPGPSRVREPGVSETQAQHAQPGHRWPGLSVGAMAGPAHRRTARTVTQGRCDLSSGCIKSSNLLQVPQAPSPESVLITT